MARCLVVAYLFNVMAMRHGEIGFVSPFRYTVLIWAIVLGVVVFGDIRNAMMLVGSTIVVVTGVFTFYRERLLAHRAAAFAQASRLTGPVMTPFGILDRFGSQFAAAGVLGHWATPDVIGKMSELKGAYVLALRLDNTIHIEFSRVNCDQLFPGWYVYVGSAKGIRSSARRRSGLCQEPTFG